MELVINVHCVPDLTAVLLLYSVSQKFPGGHWKISIAIESTDYNNRGPVNHF